ncbi:MAG: hypothetical protein O7B99_00215, partial [Planctomycetota bacterium]|nr:hypothetical protein [Planctomycetota bacterium]
GARVPESKRNSWLGLTHPAPGGSIPEAEIKAKIDTELSALPVGMDVDGSPSEVTYVFYDNTRKCIHTYGVTVGGEVAGFDAPAAFDPDKVDVDGNGTMKIPLRIEFSWEHGL